MVRKERLELSHLAALEPKSSVSTNFTTSAFKAAHIIGDICFCQPLVSKKFNFFETLVRYLS